MIRVFTWLRRRVGPSLGCLVFRLLGWKEVGTLPDERKFVAILAPHTSTWDGVIYLALAWQLRVEVVFMAKPEALEYWLVGPLLRSCGGIPVDRFHVHGVVGDAVAAIRAAETMRLVIAPEGTRKRAPCWRSGFYHIAVGADVPLVCVFADYTRKRAGLGPLIRPSGDVKADMDVIRGFYCDIRGRHPDRQGPVQLLEEAEQAASRRNDPGAFGRR